MIPEEYVTFETAKLLKKAGFLQENDIYALPLDSKGEITLQDDDDWFFDMLNLDTEEYYEDYEYFPTYETAAEAGIQVACEYLIEKKKGGER